MRDEDSLFPAAKRCVVCSQVKPLTEFPVRNKARSARHGHCKQCKAVYQRSWYERNRERHMAVTGARRDRQRRLLQRLVAEAKSRPCADCGVRYPPYVMDFDHVKGQKLGNISRMVGSTPSTAKILAEIAKCDVVCSNCHRERTFSRK
jgi:hypothetical protein